MGGVDKMLNKEALIWPLEVTPKTLKHALYGLGAGFTGISGALLASQLMENLRRSISAGTEPPKTIYVDLPKKKKDKDKKLEKKAADWPAAAGWGFGVPTGAYLGWLVYQELNKANRNIAMTNKLREMGEDYKKLQMKRMEKPEGKEKRAEFFKLDEVYDKAFNDNERQSISDSYIKGFCKAANLMKAATNGTAQKQTPALTKEQEKQIEKAMSYADYYPAILSGLLPLGFLGGYYLTKTMYPIGEEQEDTPPVKLKTRYFDPEEYRRRQLGLAKIGSEKSLYEKVDKWGIENLILPAKKKYESAVEFIKGVPKSVSSLVSGVGSWFTPEKKTLNRKMLEGAIALAGLGYLGYKLKDVVHHKLKTLREDEGAKVDAKKLKKAKEAKDAKSRKKLKR
jgi:hypothetical protein